MNDEWNGFMLMLFASEIWSRWARGLVFDLVSGWLSRMESLCFHGDNQLLSLYVLVKVF